MFKWLNVLLTGLFYDSKTGAFSSSQFWQNICFGAMTYVFIHISRKLKPDANLSDVWQMMLAYGAVVAGNRAAIFFIKRKFGDGDNSNVDGGQCPPPDPNSGPANSAGAGLGD
jgi:hypothetical protein